MGKAGGQREGQAGGQRRKDLLGSTCPMSSHSTQPTSPPLRTFASGASRPLPAPVSLLPLWPPLLQLLCQLCSFIVPQSDLAPFLSAFSRGLPPIWPPGEPGPLDGVRCVEVTAFNSQSSNQKPGPALTPLPTGHQVLGLLPLTSLCASSRPAARGLGLVTTTSHLDLCGSFLVATPPAC